jgi:hypothetical protein
MITDDKRWKLRKQFSAYNRLLDRKSISEYQSRTRFIPTNRLRENLKVLPDEQAAPYLLRGILASTPIFFENEVNTGVEFTSYDLKKFTQHCLKLKSVIERQLDINIRTDIETKPAMQLGVLLGLIGIKTLKPRTEKTPSGGKTYFYRIDPESVQHMTDLIALDEQRKTPWDAINARYGFKTDPNWG